MLHKKLLVEKQRLLSGVGLEEAGDVGQLNFSQSLMAVVREIKESERFLFKASARTGGAQGMPQIHSHESDLNVH
jgi:hypothetical protein